MWPRKPPSREPHCGRSFRSVRLLACLVGRDQRVLKSRWEARWPHTAMRCRNQRMDDEGSANLSFASICPLTVSTKLGIPAMPVRFPHGPDQPAFLNTVLFAAWFLSKGPRFPKNGRGRSVPAANSLQSAAYSPSSLSCGKNSENPCTDGTDGGDQALPNPAGRVRNSLTGLTGDERKSTDRWGRSRKGYRVIIARAIRRKKANASSLSRWVQL